jgi:hypothetical protein
MDNLTREKVCTGKAGTTRGTKVRLPDRNFYSANNDEDSRKQRILTRQTLIRILELLLRAFCLGVEVTDYLLLPVPARV